MTVSRTIAVLALSTLALTGCSLIAPEPEPTPEFIQPDISMSSDDWEESSIEEFVDAFPDVNASFAVTIPELNVTHNEGAWVIGNGSTGFAAFDEWARSSYSITDDDRSNHDTLIETEDQLIKLSYRPSGDGFLAYFTISD